MLTTKATKRLSTCRCTVSNLLSPKIFGVPLHLGCQQRPRLGHHTVLENDVMRA
jgi:hypothetical protein